MTVICALAIGGAHAAETAAPPSEQRSGIFKAVEGSVFVINGNSRTQPQVGQAVSESDHIETGANSGAALTLADGTVLTIGANSSVALSTVRYEPAGQTGSMALQVLKGTLRMITGTLAKTNPESVKVNTPTAVIGVRGTDFIVDVQP